VSFIRPEATAALWRYGEPAIYGAITIWGLWKGWGLLAHGAWLGLVPVGIAIIATFALVGAAERALLGWRSRTPGPGVVNIREGSIAYFGPLGGAVLALDALISIEIVTTDAGPGADDVFWHLADEIGQQVSIPGGAKGAEALLDRLGSLPGFDHMAVVSAMGSTENRRFAIWSRRPHSPRQSRRLSS